MLPILLCSLRRCLCRQTWSSPHDAERYGWLLFGLGSSPSCLKSGIRLQRRAQPLRIQCYTWLYLYFWWSLFFLPYSTAGLVSGRSSVVRNARQGHGIFLACCQCCRSSQSICLAGVSRQDRLEDLHHLRGLGCYSDSHYIFFPPRNQEPNSMFPLISRLLNTN